MAPEAPDMLQVACGESFWSVRTLVSHCACVHSESCRCYPNLRRAGGLLQQKRCVISIHLPSSVSAPVTPVASPADLVLVDQECHAYSAYLVEAGRPKLFVMRPDGVIMIGAIVHGAEGVKNYFPRIFLNAV
ncbi:hypothetical protein DFJ58DRAFT_31233 [Suillus subalutaceus]|uniref:uncharacterized protein n=1 Tax=Suillus subalutaceus TaxID=48586 RepID=UPI001B86D064|nr:uncharacterized protein DFJ58DRAFT_31233 [Suillus subalutaceus]KAG1844204.1 hypothetical protein DFJ58DRAFT_31233 [Suillus subalutaceus]